MNEEGSAVTGTGGRIVDFFATAAVGEPFTSTEVAAGLGCARTTAYKNLRRLAEADVLATKKVGARGRVWWLPPDSTTERPAARRGADRSGKEFEEVLADERQYRAVFEEAFDTILIADDEARYVEVNPAACELFGLPREELLGRTIADFAVEGYDVRKAWGDFRRSDLDRGLFPLVRPDGEFRIVEFAATPDILPGLHLSVLRDVTEQRDAKAELEQERARSRRYLRTLTADAVIQIELRVDGGDALGELSSLLDCKLEFEGTATTGDERSIHYVTAVGAPAEEVVSTAAALPGTNDCRVVYESEGTTLVEFDLARSPLRTLAEAGANCRSMRCEGGVTTIVAEIGVDADLQGLVNAFTGEYPDSSVVAKRTLDRPIVTTRQYRDSLADRLTERQTETLRAAWLAGYFEWPRHSESEQLASSMGIAVPTWLRHLRLAEGKLVRWFFEELEA